MVNEDSVLKYDRYVGCVLFLFLFLRLFFGIDFSDESQYVAQAINPLINGTFFGEDLFIQQIIYIFLVPLTKLYVWIWGASGSFLFLRFLYLILVTTSGYLIYSYSRKACGDRLSYYMGAGLLSFIPFSIPSISYNTITYSFLPLILVYNFFYENKTRLTNLFFAFLITILLFSYPPIILPIILSLFITRDYKLTFMSGLFCFLAGATLILIWGFDQLLLSLKFSSQFNNSSLIPKSFLLIKQFIKPLFYVLGFLVIVRFVRKKALNKQIINISTFSLMVLATLLYTFNYGYEHWGHTILTVAFMVMIFSLRKSFSNEKFNFILVSFMASITCSFFSSNGIVNSALTLIVPLVIVLSSFNVRSINKQWVIGAFLIIISLSNYLFVYRDDNIFKLLNFTDKGPLAGIFTSQDKSHVLSGVDNFLKLEGVKNKKLLALHFPTIYTYGVIKPETRMFYIHDSNFQESVLDNIFDNLEPDFILIYKHRFNTVSDYAMAKFCPNQCDVYYEQTDFKVLRVN